MSRKSDDSKARQKPYPTSLVTETGKLLQRFRKQARLSQSEVAQELGLSESSGFKYVSWLETGRIKNPSLLTVLNYLKACRVYWSTFFQELSAIDFKLEQESIMRQVEMPDNMRPYLRHKIDRDMARYLYNTAHPKTPLSKIDLHRLREKALKKVKILLKDLLIDEHKKTSYFNCMNELIDKYDSNETKAVFDKYYYDKTLCKGAVHKIRNIVYQLARREEKRLENPKPLRQEKLHKMAKKFIRYRIKIEPIEAEVHNLLGELNTPIIYNQGYKDYARECLKVFQKFYRQDQIFLKQKLNEIKNWWVLNKLDADVLDRVKEIVMKEYISSLPRIDTKEKE